jgi:hypothetical protein
MLNDPLDPPAPHPNRDLWAEAQATQRRQIQAERDAAPQWQRETEIDRHRARADGLEPWRTPTG